MEEDKLLERINHLAHKAKTVGLTEEEIKERDVLRKEFLVNFRNRMVGVMENVYIKEEDGSVKKVERKSNKGDITLH